LKDDKWMAWWWLYERVIKKIYVMLIVFSVSYSLLIALSKSEIFESINLVKIYFSIIYTYKMATSQLAKFSQIQHHTHTCTLNPLLGFL
jgi:hypothetical protein